MTTLIRKQLVINTAIALGLRVHYKTAALRVGIFDKTGPKQDFNGPAAPLHIATSWKEALVWLSGYRAALLNTEQVQRRRKSDES